VRNVCSPKSTRSIFVDRQHDVADAEQRDDIGMPECPCVKQALARIDKDHGKIGVGCAGRHIARILLVAGCIGDDEERAGVAKYR